MSNYSHLSDKDNPYQDRDERQDLFNADIDEGYVNTVRFGVNVQSAHIGNQRQISSVYVENGLDPENVVKLSWCDFLVTFHTIYPYCAKIHGRDIIQSGLLAASDLDSIMSSVETRRYGFHNYHIATVYQGIPVTMQVVRLARGKKHEHSNGAPRTYHAKTYKRNRRSQF